MELKKRVRDYFKTFMKGISGICQILIGEENTKKESSLEKITDNFNIVVNDLNQNIQEKEILNEQYQELLNINEGLESEVIGVRENAEQDLNLMIQQYESAKQNLEIKLQSEKGMAENTLKSLSKKYKRSQKQNQRLELRIESEKKIIDQQLRSFSKKMEGTLPYPENQEIPEYDGINSCKELTKLVLKSINDKSAIIELKIGDIKRLNGKVQEEIKGREYLKNELVKSHKWNLQLEQKYKTLQSQSKTLAEVMEGFVIDKKVLQKNYEVAQLRIEELAIVEKKYEVALDRNQELKETLNSYIPEREVHTIMEKIPIAALIVSPEYEVIRQNSYCDERFKGIDMSQVIGSEEYQKSVMNSIRSRRPNAEFIFQIKEKKTKNYKITTQIMYGYGNHNKLFLCINELHEENPGLFKKAVQSLYNPKPAESTASLILRPAEQNNS